MPESFSGPVNFFCQNLLNIFNYFGATLFFKNSFFLALKSQNLEKSYNINKKKRAILIGITISMHQFIGFLQDACDFEKRVLY